MDVRNALPMMAAVDSAPLIFPMVIGALAIEMEVLSGKTDSYCVLLHSGFVIDSSRENEDEVTLRPVCASYGIQPPSSTNRGIITINELSCNVVNLHIKSIENIQAIYGGALCEENVSKIDRS